MQSPSEPTWPISRNLERYNSLLGIDIPHLLQPGGRWIEIGPGADASPMLSFIDRQDLSLRCIGPHARALPPAIAFTSGTVPEHAGFLAENRACARLVTDVYAGLSYSDDPLLNLIYCTLLLAPGGTFAAFTELFRFGELHTWNLITEFFRIDLGSAITFETVSVRGDASKVFSTCVRIRVVGGDTRDKDFAELVRRAHETVGLPVQSAPLWVAADASARICRVDYRIANC